MTFRDDLLPCLSAIRAIPFDCGVRPYSVAVEVKTWDGEERGEGAESLTLTPVTEADGAPPKIQWLNAEEIAVGGYESGTVQVGPITPGFPGGGTALSVLEPTLPTNSTFRYILTGPRYPAGAYFRLKELRHHRGFQYVVVLEQMAQT